MNELEHLVKGLPDKERAKLLTKAKISPSTLLRWLKNPRKLITIDGALAIKEVLDKHYTGDHDIYALTKPVRIHGRKLKAA